MSETWLRRAVRAHNPGVRGAGIDQHLHGLATRSNLDCAYVGVICAVLIDRNAIDLLGLRSLNYLILVGTYDGSSGISKRWLLTNTLIPR